MFSLTGCYIYFSSPRLCSPFILHLFSMHATIHFQLQQTLKRLQKQAIPLHKPTEQFELRLLLVTTIRMLRELSAQELPYRQHCALLRDLNLLEQQAQVLAPPGKVAPSTWHFLHASLKATIKATLLQQASTHPIVAQGRRPTSLTLDLPPFYGLH